uniref:Uncharacterized protein n=1 Tax=Parascaris univalens TaxID=6257 RepID=A0A914ZM35_PARUN
IYMFCEYMPLPLMSKRTSLPREEKTISVLFATLKFERPNCANGAARWCAVVPHNQQLLADNPALTFNVYSRSAFTYLSMPINSSTFLSAQILHIELRFYYMHKVLIMLTCDGASRLGKLQIF